MAHFCCSSLKSEDSAFEPPNKKQKLLQVEYAEKARYFRVESISETISGVQEQLGTDDQRKVVDLLAKLYPTWERVLLAVEEPSQLVDTIVLLSYIDCGWPKLFLTQDEMLRMKSKILHQAKQYGTAQHDIPDDLTSEPDGKTSYDDTSDDELCTLDGIATQLQVDSARLELSENLGDVALILNAFLGWCVRDQKEKLAWCEKYLINVTEMKVLGKAFVDLLKLIERETNFEMKWINSPVMNKEQSRAEKMKRWTSVLISTCPELLYIHSGVPGQEYLNFLTGNVEPHYLNRNFNFDMNVEPPEYIISFPCNLSTSTFKECKYDNLLTIRCDSNLVVKMCELFYEDTLKARCGDKVIKAAVITDIGPAIINKLLEKQQQRIADMENDIHAQCSIPYVLVHVQVDQLRNELHVYSPKSCAEKAREVVQYHVDLVKAGVESRTVELHPYKDMDKSVSLGAGCFLHGMSLQEEAEKTVLIYVNTTHQNRETLYQNFDESVMRTMLVVHGISEDNIVTLRKCKRFPDITLWGSVVFQDPDIKKKYIALFNASFQKDGGKFQMEPVKDTKYEVYQRFEVKREVKNHIHIYFFSDVAFERAKKFPWQDYWVIDKLNFYRATREANFIFRMPRGDLNKLKNDMVSLCGGLTTHMMNLNHKIVRPDDWSDATIQQVMVKVRAECFTKSPIILSEMMDLRRAVIHKTDKMLQGYVRWESSSKTNTLPQRFETCLDDAFTMNLTKAGELRSVVLSRDTYKVLQNLLNMYPASILDIVHETDGTVVVLVVVGSIDEKEVFNLMEPEIIYGLDPQLAAMHEAGYCPFLYVCKEQSVAVEVSAALRQIKVYGIDNDRAVAAQLIRQMLFTQHGIDWLRNFGSFPLLGLNVPNNMLKEMFRQWGSKLEKLRLITGCAEVTLDSVMDHLQCVGSPGAIHKVKRALDELCSSLTGREVTLYSCQKTCCACFSTICDVTNQSYTLEHCGHFYCINCLVTQIKTRVQNKALPMLPIKCAKDACGALMSVQDILTACTKGNIDILELLDVVYKCHITANRDYVRHCTTDLCPVVYEIPVEGQWTFNCPSCQCSTCINCNTPWHLGLSCVVKTLIDNLQDAQLKEWILADPDNRKMCPECHVGIEKNGGCANVLCTGCMRSLCWKCMQIFKTSNECYAHINKFH